MLQGLLGRRLVAEELAQETFLVAYRDRDRISRLHNPRAGPQGGDEPTGAFLRAYLRQQQAQERDAVPEEGDDSIKLADDHAEVWQTIPCLRVRRR